MSLATTNADSRGNVRIVRTTRRRRHALEIDVVLDRERHAVQRQRLRIPRGERRRVSKNSLARQKRYPRPPVRRPRNIGQHALDDIDRGEMTGAISIEKRGDQQRVG